jgi:hypothetical protein
MNSALRRRADFAAAFIQAPFVGRVSTRQDMAE